MIRVSSLEVLVTIALCVELEPLVTIALCVGNMGVMMIMIDVSVNAAMRRKRRQRNSHFYSNLFAAQRVLFLTA